MTATALSALIDVRQIAPRERHALIRQMFGDLVVGHSMELVNDHEPKPLHRQFEIDMPGAFTWDYLEAGPQLWRVKITKVSHPHAQGRCCGSCGGS